MKKIAIILFLVQCLWGVDGFSQAAISPPAEEQKGFQWDRVFIGGNLGAQFGNVTVVNVSPLVGYRFTEKIVAGFGATYIYYNYKSYNNFSSSIYGGNIFGRYYILENVFVHGEYEILNVDSYDFPGVRTNIENIYVGGGFRQALGSNSFLTIMALWNINENKYSPYSNPIIRMGVNFGL